MLEEVYYMVKMPAVDQHLNMEKRISPDSNPELWVQVPLARQNQSQVMKLVNMRDVEVLSPAKWTSVGSNPTLCATYRIGQMV